MVGVCCGVIFSVVVMNMDWNDFQEESVYLAYRSGSTVKGIHSKRNLRLEPGIRN